MKIRKLRLKNIGVFDDEEIEFQPGPKSDKAEIHILTGENGTGKSTILMALAGAFDQFQFDTSQHPSNHLHKRFRYFEYFEGKDGRDNCKSSITVFFEEASKQTKLVGDPRTNYVHTYVTAKEINEYRNLITLSGLPSVALDFAVFAYSGYRYIKAQQVDAITEVKENPLKSSLEFEKSYLQNGKLTINQFIANNISKTAIEEKRDSVRARKFADVLTSLEKAISDITGNKTEFDLQTEPLNLIVKINEENLDFDVLPDGLRSLISWIGDLLMRVDLLKWNDDLPAFEKNLILFLDEIEVHLHPAWQRKVLPVVQKLFKNSQIFLSTHSPFVVNSVDGAWVYELVLDSKGKAKVADVTESKSSYSYQSVLREVFGIDERFGGKTQEDLDEFYRQRDLILQANGNSKQKPTKDQFLKLAKKIAVQSAELQSIVLLELMQLSKRTGDTYDL